MLTRIRNAQAARKGEVLFAASKEKLALAALLRDEGYVGEVSTTSVEGKPMMRVALKYFQGKPVISHLKRVSKPGLRIYKGADALPRIRGGLGVAVVSTSKGLMTDRVARREGVGGEVICTIA
jgi:small subunit ribosomal protein S8